jgi:nucleoside-diphosphate-sugar epimerase
VTVLLVGGTGFLGSYVAARLAHRGPRVLARPASNVARLPPGADVHYGSLEDLDSVRRALHGATHFVYCASMGFGHVPPLVPLLEHAGLARTVFVGTTAVFTSLPARSRAVRLTAEDAVHASTLDWTLLRPTMIYGSERDRNISRLLRFLARSPVFPVLGDGRARHQPVFVEDLASAVVAAIDAPLASRRAYNLAGAAPLTYADLVRTAARAIGRDVSLVHVPLRLGLVAARLAGRLPIRAPVTPEQVLRLAEDKAFAYADAARNLGFRPRSFADGVRLEARALGLV